MYGFLKTFSGEISGIEGESLIFVLEGEVMLDGTELCAGRGMVCFNGEAAKIKAQSGEQAKCLAVGFDLSLAEIHLAMLGLGRENKIFDFSANELLMKTANCFFTSESEYDNAMLERGIAGVLASFIKKGEHESAESYVLKAERYIEENLHLPIKIEELADELSISRGYLRNIFVRSRRCSPQEYLMKRRMEKAKELLLSTDISIALIASEVGYSDALGFSRMFKRYCGVSPSEYRHDSAIYKNDNAIKEEKVRENRGDPISVTTVRTEIAEEIEAKASEPEKIETIDDIAALIEKAAMAAAKAEQEKKESEAAPPPFWLL